MTTTKKISTAFISLTLSVALVMLFALPVMAADGPYSNVSNSAAFEDSGINSIQNKNNPALRFGAGGAIAIPGEGGQHADTNSVIAPYSVNGSQSILRPNGFNN